jgi:hypothetical protein
MSGESTRRSSFASIPNSASACSLFLLPNQCTRKRAVRASVQRSETLAFSGLRKSVGYFAMPVKNFSVAINGKL